MPRTLPALAVTISTALLLPATASAGGTPSITTKNVTVAESATSVRIPLTLSARQTRTVSVRYSVRPGTAGADFVATTTGTAKFRKGSRSATITVRLTPDSVDEPDERFTVTLSKPVRAKLGRVKRSTVTITDDDPPPPSNGGNGQPNQQPGPGGGNTTPPAPPVPKISVEDVTADEAAGVATVGVVLDQAVATPVTVDYAAAAGTDNNAAAGTVGIAPGRTRGTFTVPLANDIADEDAESFAVTLSNASGGELVDATGAVSITDDDPAPAISVGDAFRVEANGVAIVPLTLDRPSERTPGPSVNFFTTLGSATPGGLCGPGVDYVPIPALNVAFGPGETSKSVNVLICDTAGAEVLETFFGQLSNPMNATIGDGTGTVTIIDND